MNKWIAVLALLVSSLSLSVRAAIYQCVDLEGKTLFSQNRCNSNATPVPIRPEFKARTSSPTTGLRKGETRTLKQINRREKSRAKKRNQEVKDANNTTVSKKRCKKAKKKIRKLKNQRRSGCKNRQCEQIDEKIADYREQKARYCY